MPARKRLAAALSLGVAFTGLQLVTAPSATAASSGLVIAEFYGNGGNANAVRNADFIELHNPTSGSISLSGLSVQYRSAAGAGTANGVSVLSGTVDAGETFLVQLSNATATGTALPSPDQVATPLNAGGTNGTIWLASTTTAINPGTASVINNPQVIDLVGFGTSNTFEVAAATGVSDNTKSFSRTNTAVDGDNNSTDFLAGTPSPTNSAGETDPPAVPLAATDPGDKTWFVGTAIPTINLAAVGGTPPYSWVATGLPSGVTQTGNQISGTPTVEGTGDVTIEVTDSAVPTATVDTETFTFTVEPELEPQPIAEVQGTGPASPLVDTTVTTEGVVTALYRTGGLNGMFIQTGGTGSGPDATPGASDAIFVYGGTSMDGIPAGIALGDSVEVTGAVSEFNGSTQITPAFNGTGVVELGSPFDPVTALAIAYPTTEVAREAQEGMLLAPTNELTVTNVFSSNRFAEIGLATGSTPLVQPTEVARASDAAGIAAVKADNAARAVTLDRGRHRPCRGGEVGPCPRPRQVVGGHRLRRRVAGGVDRDRPQDPVHRDPDRARCSTMPREAVGAVPSRVYRIVAPLSAVMVTRLGPVSAALPGLDGPAQPAAIRSTVL